MMFNKILMVAVLFGVGTPDRVEAAETVKQYFVNNNKQSQTTMTATPMVGTYGFDGVEVGGKFSFEPFPNGFVEPINDSVSFEAGLFRGVGSKRARTLATVAMRWDFNLIPLWSVFGAPGFVIRNDRKINEDDYEESDPEGRLAFCIGGLFNFADDKALRLELDYGESTMRAGYMFRF